MTRRGLTSSQTDTSSLSASLSVGTTSLPLPPVIEFACAAHTLVDEYVASSPFGISVMSGSQVVRQCSKEQVVGSIYDEIKTLTLYRPWIPGEHHRGICAVDCVAARRGEFTLVSAE